MENSLQILQALLLIIAGSEEDQIKAREYLKIMEPEIWQ